MSPDSSLSEFYANPLPRYLECYPLVHVVLVGDVFWGSTGGTNQHFALEKGVSPPVTLGYTNMEEELYISMPHMTMYDGLTKGTSQINLNNLRQYESFRFGARQDASLVWDGENPETTDRLQEAIDAGSMFRIVFENAEGIVFSQSVDIALFFTDSGTVEMNTYPALFPDFFLNPGMLSAVVRERLPSMVGENSDRTKMARLTSGLIAGFHSVRSDGTYLGFPEIISGMRKRWRQARLYAF